MKGTYYPLWSYFSHARWWGASPGRNLHGFPFSERSIPIYQKCWCQPILDHNHPFQFLCALVTGHIFLVGCVCMGFFDAGIYSKAACAAAYLQVIIFPFSCHQKSNKTCLRFKTNYFLGVETVEQPGLWWGNKCDASSCCKSHMWFTEQIVWQRGAHSWLRWCGRTLILTLSPTFHTLYIKFPQDQYICCLVSAVQYQDHRARLHFFVMNFKGDWKYLKQLFNLERHPSTEQAILRDREYMDVDDAPCGLKSATSCCWR